MNTSHNKLIYCLLLTFIIILSISCKKQLPKDADLQFLGKINNENLHEQMTKMSTRFSSPEEFLFNPNGWLSTNYFIFKIKNNSKNCLCCYLSPSGYLTTTITTVDLLPPKDSTVLSPEFGSALGMNWTEGGYNCWLDPGDEQIFLAPIRMLAAKYEFEKYILVFPSCIFTPHREIGIGGYDPMENFYISLPTNSLVITKGGETYH
ncbi:MAG: hypothetical protein R2787_03830 [Saprospiraceae bacterium]